MSTIVYKLTDQDNKTRAGEYNECVWGPGVTHSGTGSGDLCGPGFIHAYLSPELAVLLNPIHANIRNPKLWECVVSGIDKNDNDLKVGSISLTTTREIPLPTITARQMVVFAIFCARKSLKITGTVIPEWEEWSSKFLSGTTADDAIRAAARAARAAAADAYVAAARAAAAAADAAAAAADAAYVAAADAPRAAAYDAIRAAPRAAAAAADAYVAAERCRTLDLPRLAKQALTYQ